MTATPPGGLALLILVLLGDFLLWDLSPGIALVLFAAAVLAVSGARHWGWFAVGALPAIDLVQPLSVGFLLAGMVLAKVGPRGALGFLRHLPRVRPGWRVQLGPGLWRNWAFPLGGSLVLVSLLGQANPLIARALTPDLGDLPLRLAFWAGLALAVLPFLAAPPPEWHPRAPNLPGLGLNAGSVLRALVLFNLALGAQMAFDLQVVLSGPPPGISLATFAHRGAYPLLATALLAGAFALAARPFLNENNLIRPLLILWLVQNIALTGSAALRLQSYVQAWGLSYLRVHAAIWMGLVALGLALCLWQVLRGHPNGWMLRRTAALGLGTLYVCGFVNFAGVIAAENLSRPDPDFYYICGLGPMAAAALAAHGWSDACSAPPRIDHWQEWGFRGWSVAHRVAAHEDPAR